MNKHELLPLRLPRHRATTAQLCAVFPFVTTSGISCGGPKLGIDVLTGGEAFRFDPFAAYEAGYVTNPNVLIAGEPGTGKSAAVKTLIHRCAQTGERWIAIADPKGEYRELAAVLRLGSIDLRPGGASRLNPLDVAVDSLAHDAIARERSLLVAALLTIALRRELTPLEDAVISWTLDAIGDIKSPTLRDVRDALASPSRELVKRSSRTMAVLTSDAEQLRLGLDKLLHHSLKGMFDSHSTVSVDWRKRGVVLDLSGVHDEPEALAAVMVASTAWLRNAVRHDDGIPRIQVLDEAWSLLASERTARYLQASLKLGRAHGVANILVVHRLSDLRSQSADGSAAAKIAAGLCADTQTRILFRQSSDQLADAQSLLGLNTKEAELLGKLQRGRAIWKIGDHVSVVAHEVTKEDLAFCDTDTRMVGGNQ